MEQHYGEHVDCVTEVLNAYLARLQQLIEDRNAALAACEKITDADKRLKCIDAAIVNYAAGASSAYYAYVLDRQKCEGGRKGGCECG